MWKANISVPNCTEQNRTVPNRTELYRIEPNCTEQNRTVPNRTELYRTEPNCTELYPALTVQHKEQNFQLGLTDDDSKSGVGHGTAEERKEVDEEIEMHDKMVRACL